MKRKKRNTILGDNVAAAGMPNNSEKEPNTADCKQKGTEEDVRKSADGAMKGTDGAMVKGTEEDVRKSADDAMRKGADSAVRKGADSAMPKGADSAMQKGADGAMRKGTAVVVKHTGSHYMLSCLPQWKPFVAVVRGKLRLKGSSSTNPIAVGDIVDFQGNSFNGFTITGIHDRKNCIVRRSTNLSRQNHVIAANIDRVFLVVTLKDPEIKLQFVDRFLVTCEAYGVPVTILLNKADLYRGEEFPSAVQNYNSENVQSCNSVLRENCEAHTSIAKENCEGHTGLAKEYREGYAGLADEELAQMAAGFMQIYRQAGYQVIETSVETGYNIPQLKNLCKDNVVLFSGQSGVGKSSLVNALDPSLNLKTAEISQAHLQGRHTTTFYQMHPLSCGGFVVDTPGIRGFGLVDFSKEELSNYFPEMLKIEDNCRFVPCTHTHEPGCAVKEAVEREEISPLRYASYLAMLEDDGKYREADE